jgi:hypothetical protein
VVNVLRGQSPAAKNARKTVCLRGHDDWSFRPDGKGRVCRACDTLRGGHVRGGPGPTRLADEEVAAIRALAAARALPQRVIAARFGVNQSHVSRLLSNKTRRSPGAHALRRVPVA